MLARSTGSEGLRDDIFQGDDQNTKVTLDHLDLRILPPGRFSGDRDQMQAVKERNEATWNIRRKIINAINAMLPETVATSFICVLDDTDIVEAESGSNSITVRLKQSSRRAR